MKLCWQNDNNSFSYYVHDRRRYIKTDYNLKFITFNFFECTRSIKANIAEITHCCNTKVFLHDSNPYRIKHDLKSINAVRKIEIFRWVQGGHREQGFDNHMNIWWKHLALSQVLNVLHHLNNESAFIVINWLFSVE